MDEFNNLGFTLRYNFHTEGIRLYCMKCNEEIFNSSLSGWEKMMPGIYEVLDTHTRKCYPETDKL